MFGTDTATKLGAGFVLASFGLALAVYPTMPEQMIIHWEVGLDRSVDVGRAPKEFVLFLAPSFAAALFALLRAGPALVGGSASNRPVRSMLTYAATGFAGLFFLMQVAIILLN